MSSGESIAVPMVKVKKSKRSREAVPEISITPSEIIETPIVESDSVTSTNKLAPTTTTKTEGGDEEGEPEVPALSHKEKRLAKRRKLSGIDDPVIVLPTLQKSINTIPGVPGTIIGNTPSKSAFGIWVGNMAFGTTQKMLLGWFESKGLKEVTRLNMPGGKRPGEANRGFAYLDFPSSVEVTIAVGLSEQHLDGRKLLIKSSTDFTGRPSNIAALPLPSTLDPSSLTSSSSTTTTIGGAIVEGPNQTLNKTARKILDRQRNQPGPTLFIGNLGFETEVEDIRGMFDAHQRAQGAWAPKIKVVEKEDGKMEVELEEVNDPVEGEVDEDRDEDESDDSEDEEEVSDKEEEVEVEEAIEGSDEDGGKEVKKPKKVRSKVEKGPKDLSKANDAGIRKIRLGTFEDTGKCKGWAFVDFHLPEQCTRALLNIRNHSLNGRNLVVEYGSSEAVRRGAIGTRGAIAAGGGRGRPGARGGRGESGGRGGGAGTARGKGREWDDGDVVSEAKRDYFDDDEVPEERVYVPRGGEGSGRGGDRGGRGASRGGRGAPRGAIAANGRMKSGAALAAVQRGSEAIVESSGRKITFD